MIDGTRRFRFRPALSTTLMMGVLAAACLWLGLWQSERRVWKEDLIREFERAPERPLSEGLAGSTRFSRVRVEGAYDADHPILLDNRIFGGRVGVHVLSPFTTVEGVTLLVNRGWLPMAADRRSLPDVATRRDPLTISGTLAQPPEDGVTLGEAP